MPGRSSYQDPVKTFDYIVEIDGFKRFGFSEVTGLQANTAVISYREGGDNHSVRKSAGLTEYDPIVLKRGQVIDPNGVGDDDFYDWYLQVQSIRTQGFADPDYRRNGTVVQFHRDGRTARRWDFINSWPSRYKPFGDLGGNDSNDSIEELELQHEGFEREGGRPPAGIGQSLSASLGMGSG
jgi:phage tail-like protein